MDQILALTVSIVLLVFVAGALVQMTSAMFGHRPDWFASLGWLVGGIRKGAYRLLITVANIFRDAAREINRAVRNQSMWARVIFFVVALIPWSVGILFWIPAQILKLPGRKK